MRSKIGNFPIAFVGKWKKYPSNNLISYATYIKITK
jgi:hypothetical protein